MKALPLLRLPPLSLRIPALLTGILLLSPHLAIAQDAPPAPPAKAADDSGAAFDTRGAAPTGVGILREEITAPNDDWVPIDYQSLAIVKGSALDFAPYLDAPAGQHGEAICQGDHFVFRNAPDRPLRFYGVTMGQGLTYTDKATCERLTDYVAASGYNLVRLHGYQLLGDIMKEIGSPEFNPARLDQLEYFISCLKKKGIYYTIELDAWPNFKVGDASDVKEFANRKFRFESNAILPISGKLTTWLKQYSLNLLTHVNPYTGVALKDDPGLVAVEITNENSLYQEMHRDAEFVAIYKERCGEFLKAKSSGATPSAQEIDRFLPQFVLQLQEQFLLNMIDFLRKSGVKKPLTDITDTAWMVDVIPRSHLDYVDTHAYWALFRLLPTTPGVPATYRVPFGNPNTVGWDTVVKSTAPARLFGKPFVSGEYNSSYPSPYWSYMGPFEATLAGLQGWSAIMRCGLWPYPEQALTPFPVRKIQGGSSPLIMLSERIGSLLFAQNEVKTLETKMPFVLTPDYLREKVDIDGRPLYPASYYKLAFQYQLGSILLDGQEKLADFPTVVAPPDMKLPDSLKDKKVIPAADTADLTAPLADAGINAPSGDGEPIPWQEDRAAGTAQIVTPKSECFLLPETVSDATGSSVTVHGNKTVTVAFAGSLDGRSLVTSTRILALYLTDLHNTGTDIQYQKDNSVIVKAVGKTPLLVHQGEIQMEFRMKDRPLPHVWALKYDGSRSVEITPNKTADGFSFSARAVTNPQTFSAYEMSWE